MAHWHEDAFSVTSRVEKTMVFRTGFKSTSRSDGRWVWDAQGHHLGTIALPEQPANLAWGDSDCRSKWNYRLCTTIEDYVPYRIR